MTKIKNNLSISEVLGHIQEELIKSEEDRIKSGRSRLFITDSCEIELKCVLKKQNDLKAGASIFKLVTISDDLTISKEEVHTIKINFKTGLGENIEGIIEETSNGLYPRSPG